MNLAQFLWYKCTCPGKLRQRARGRRGNIAVLTALAAVPIALVMTSALEMTLISKERSHLQAAVDAAALAGATELSLASRGSDGIVETARAVAQQAMTDGRLTADFDVLVDRTKGEVVVKGHISRKSMMGIGDIGSAELNATATAQSLQSVPLCILQTKAPTASRISANKLIAGSIVNGFTLNDTASISANGCLIHANENITVASSARIEATRIQAVGKATGTIMPTGNSGALPIADPFQGMDLNPPAACSSFLRPRKVIVDKTDTLLLQPGLHCEAFMIQKNATLSLAPGEHYFFGDLDMKDDSKLIGEDVALIFGSLQKFDFGDSTTVRLSARLTGRFAGFLIATHQLNFQPFTISSQNVDELLGTIYIPGAELVISSAGSVAEESAWSVIVARVITLKNNPKLVINTSYVASGVPVPEGVGPSNGAPRLTK
jgi:Putative Flp pilus-assembly TadE/G-like